MKRIFFIFFLIIFTFAQAQVSLETTTGISTEVSGSLKVGINGNWTNLGSLRSGNSTITLNGTINQSISNANGSFNDLIINKSSGAVQATSDFSVDGTLTLTSGDVFLNGYMITLGKDALLSETVGNTVQGPTGQIQTTRTLDPPAENIAGMGFEINSSNLGSTQLIRRHAAMTGNGHNSIFRTFEILPTINNGLSASLVFHYDESELNGQIEADLQLYHSTDRGTTWSLAGGTVNPTANTIILNGIDEIAGYWTTSDQNMAIDSEAPAISCVSTSLIKRSTDLASCDYTIQGTELDATFTDNEAGGSITNDFNNSSSLANEVLSQGTTTVLWTATDAQGNSSSCSISIEISDQIDPTIACPTGGMRTSDVGQTYYTVQGTEFDAMASDNCNSFLRTNDFNNSNTLEGEQLSVGVHTITWTVNDRAGNTSFCTVDIEVAQNCGVSITNIVSTDPTGCGAMDGSISITATGVNLEYSINNGLSFQDEGNFTGLSQRTYDIIVREIGLSSCTTVSQIVLSDPTLPVISEIISVNSTGCTPNLGGTISIIATGDNLEYSINGGNSFGTNSIISPLLANVYDIVIRNSEAPSCVVTDQVEVFGPKTPIVNNIFGRNISDCMANDGQIVIDAIGENLEYNINGGTYQANNIFTDLEAGIYSIDIRESDYPSCQDPNGIELFAPNLPTIENVTSTDPTDCAINDGSIFISTIGSNLEYSIDGGNAFQNSNSFTGLASGDYNIVVRDANAKNCEATSSTSLTEPGYCECTISTVNVLSTSDCDPWTNTYSQTLEIVYHDALNAGSIIVNGVSFDVTGSPQTVVLTDLISDGQTVDLNVYWSEYVDCKVEIIDAFNAPADCSVPCDIISVVAGDPYDCEPNSDTYSRDLTVTYQGTNLSGKLKVKIDGGSPISFPLTYQSPQVLTLTNLPSNGKWTDIQVFISQNNNCSWVANNLFKNPQNCGDNPGGDCDITTLTAGDQRCIYDLGTYEQDLIITYENEPLGGSIRIKVNNQGGWKFFPITGSPQVLTLANLNPDGKEVDIFVKFSDDNGCTYSANDLFEAPNNCVLPCAITSIATGNQSSCDPATNTYSQELMILYENQPFNGELVVNGQSFSITGSPQTIILTDLPANGAHVDVTAYFTENQDCQISEIDLFTAPDACTAPPTGNGEVLFVVRSRHNLNQGDEAVKERLEDLGYTVIIKGQGPAKPQDAERKMAILISNSISAHAVKDKFAEVSTPVIVWEVLIYDDMGMTQANNGTDFGQDNNEKSIDIDAPNHLMAAGLSGEAEIFANSSAVTWGKPNNNAIKIASTQGNNPNQWAIFGYEAGADMASLTAPARRVGIFLKDSEIPKMNDNGWALFDAAVCWATGCDTLAEERFAPIAKDIKVFPNPFLNELNMEWEAPSQEVVISLTNMLGIQVYQQKQYFKGKLKLHLSNLPEGLYILSVAGERGFKQQMKVVRE